MALCSMKTNRELVAIAQGVIESAAKAFKDRGADSYSADRHAAGMGLALHKAQKENGEALNADQLAALCHATYNHSAFRQKFEKAGIFPKAEARVSGLGNLLAELSEEGVSE